MTTQHQSPMKLGTMVKIWHDSRGIDYIFCGTNSVTQRVYLLNANCINKDGNVRANTKRFHKTLKMSNFNKVKVVKGVNRVLGTKPVDPALIQAFVNKVTRANISYTNFETPKKNKIQFICNPMIDARHSLIYNT